MATSVPALPRTTPARLLALCVALVASLLTAVSASADHDRRGTPVDGVQQSYTAGQAGSVEQLPPELFLAGSPTDQVDKSGNPEAPTFTSEAPGGATPILQQTSPFASAEIPGDPLAAFWSAPVERALDGTLQLDFFFSSPNPGSVIIQQVEVTVFADPDLTSGEAQPDLIVGREIANLSVGPTSSQNLITVPLRAAVAAGQRLLIQVVPTFSDAGQGLQVEYGSSGSPSGFAVAAPGAGGTPAEPSADAPYDGEPFTVQAVGIGREALEPTIGVDAEGNAFVAAGTFDSVIGTARTEILRSTDGGINWESIQPNLPGDVTSNPPATLDPYVYVEEDSGRVFSIDLLVACANLLFSDDAGDSFEQNQAACGEFVNDHQTLFAGPPPVNNPAVQATDPDFPEILYYCFNRIADSDCGRSVDGGRTFTPTVGEPAFTGFDPEAGGFCGGLHGHIATDSEGRIFLPKGHCGFPWVSVSDDGGQTWQRTQVSEQVSSAGIQNHVAVDAADNVYYVWWDAEERLPYMAVSTDHGATFGEPMMIAPPGVNEVNWPSVAAGDEGRVTIYFPGTTVDDREDKTRPWNSYVVATENALDPEPLFVSTTANPVSDPIHRGDCLGRCAGMFDFLDVIVSPHDGDIWAVATDTCTAVRECNSNPDAQGNGAPRPSPLDPNPSTAVARDGVAIRQLSGPSMRDTGEQPTEPPPPLPTETPSETPSEVPDEEPQVSRVEGESRLETSVEVSRAAFDSADTVVLARMDDYPDALAASGLAAEVDAPVLLTGTEGLDPLVAEELERLGATDAYLMGGVEALSEQVERDLDDAGVEHERIGGFERFETAALIADEIVSLGGPVDQVVLALGGRGGGLDAWPDALAAGNLAAAGRAPIVLTTPDDLPEITSDALDRLVGDGDPVFLAGGTEAIDEAQERSVADRGFAVTRLGGADRYGTAVLIVEEARRQGADVNPLLLASGEIFADALVAGPAARRLGGSLLLVHPEDLDSSAATSQFLEDNRDSLDQVLVIGGSDTVADRVVDQVEEALVPAG